MSFVDIAAQNIANLEKAMLDLDKAIFDSISEEEPEYKDVAKTLVHLHSLKSGIAMIYDMVANLLDRTMGEIPEIDLENGVRIEKMTASTRRAWKHQDLAQEIARRLTMTNIDMNTGESTKSAEELISEILRFLQPSYWRVKELSTIGVNADNYCEVLEPKTSIVIRKPKS